MTGGGDGAPRRPPGKRIAGVTLAWPFLRNVTSGQDWWCDSLGTNAFPLYPRTGCVYRNPSGKSVKRPREGRVSHRKLSISKAN